jgi:hypothetical protein
MGLAVDQLSLNDAVSRMAMNARPAFSRRFMVSTKNRMKKTGQIYFSGEFS